MVHIPSLHPDHFPSVLCPGCQVPLVPTTFEGDPLSLSTVTYACTKCAAVTKRLCKLHGHQAGFVACMRTTASHETARMLKARREIAATCSATRRVIEQSREVLRALDQQESERTFFTSSVSAMKHDSRYGWAQYGLPHDHPQPEPG